MMDLECSSIVGSSILWESCRKVEAASDVVSIPHSTEQKGNPTKASGTVN